MSKSLSPAFVRPYINKPSVRLSLGLLYVFQVAQVRMEQDLLEMLDFLCKYYYLNCLNMKFMSADLSQIA